MLFYQLGCSGEVPFLFLQNWLLAQVLQQVKGLIEVIARVSFHSQHRNTDFQHLREIALFYDLRVEHQQAQLMAQEYVLSRTAKITEFLHHPLHQRLQEHSDQVESLDHLSIDDDYP